MNDRMQAVRELSPGGRPTMKDVASRAGVALKTVSRVVNGEPGVTPETTKRVLGAISDLGFRRNESARLLRTGRTATLGFIADTWADQDSVLVYRGVEEVAREHGYLTYAGSTEANAAREEELALAMCSRRVDGLVIITGGGAHEYLMPEIEAGVAAVFALRSPVAQHGASPGGLPGLGTLGSLAGLSEAARRRVAVVELDSDEPMRLGRVAGELLLRRLNGQQSGPG